MKPNYCLPIIKAEKDRIVEIINANLGDYRYFEVWLDYTHDIDEVFVSQLIELLGERLLAVFRRQSLGAPVMDETLRRRLIARLSDSHALVDLDITTQQSELTYIKTEGLPVALIASYHNYRETPDTLQLRRIIDTMEPYRPTVYKLSTLCRTEDDAVRLLQLLLELRDRDVRAIVSGMGEYGTATRIFGTMWGNDMVFAPIDRTDQSAPGQLSRQQLEIIFKELSR